MAYDGEILDQCGTVDMNCSNIAVVAVSGSGPNVCGHLLIGTGVGGNINYFHVAEFRNYPKYMTETGYRRYLKENGKSELRRRTLALPDPSGAMTYLEDLMSKKWTWGVLPNNCVAFVEEVISAGGGSWSSYSNCPAAAISDSIEERANRFMNQLENEIYSLYGVR